MNVTQGGRDLGKVIGTLIVEKLCQYLNSAETASNKALDSTVTKTSVALCASAMCHVMSGSLTTKYVATSRPEVGTSETASTILKKSSSKNQKTSKNESFGVRTVRRCAEASLTP